MIRAMLDCWAGLIIAGGYNIYPKEIELILDDQPGVLESAVIVCQYADFGESVGCFGA